MYFDNCHQKMTKQIWNWFLNKRNNLLHLEKYNKLVQNEDYQQNNTGEENLEENKTGKQKMAS